jgi:glycine/serine hydroxymethyltransferase
MNPLDILGRVDAFDALAGRRLSLIASENWLSARARAVYSSDVINRYSFPGSGGAWPGRALLEMIEEETIAAAKRIFRCAYANVRPISGLQCMTVTLSTFSEPGQTVLSLDPKDGGHGVTGQVARRLGADWRTLPYDAASMTWDKESLSRLANTTKPTLIYLDQYMCLLPLDVRRLREIFGPEPIIHFDASHTLGLIAGGQFQDPLREGANSMGGSTHKSLPGPQHGMFLTDDARLAERFNDECAIWISNHHLASVAALGVVLTESMETGCHAARTIANAKALARGLADGGQSVSGERFGYTETHQIWLDTSPDRAVDTADRLAAAGILVNAMPVPYVPEESGLRIGVQEATQRGLTPQTASDLGSAMSHLMRGRADPTHLQQLRTILNGLRRES